MSTNGSITLNLDQLRLMREARGLIKQEFNVTLCLADMDVMDQLYRYALQSNGEAIFKIYQSLITPVLDQTDAPVHTINSVRHVIPHLSRN